MQCLVHITLLMGLCITSLAEAAEDRLDLADPNDALKATRKVNCSLKDGVPTVLTWAGKIYSRREGESDRHLFNTEAFSIRQCKSYQDEARGYGFRIVAREIVLYLDPQTNEILRIWTNPWTGKDVEVVHISNDPMSLPFPFYAFGRDGAPHVFEGQITDGKVRYPVEKILFQDGVMGGDFQKYVGGHYHATELFHFFMSEDDLLDRSTDEVQDMYMSNTRISQWLPWMEMGSRPGLLIHTGSGQKVSGFEALSDRLKTEVAVNYPAFRNPPDLDDMRPMANSAVHFKRRIDNQRAAETGNSIP